MMLGRLVARRYQLTAGLGRGSTASVFAALDQVRQEMVAIKLLHAELSSEAEVLGRLQREGALLRRIRHPHVAAFLEDGATETGVPFLVMELVRGTDLQGWIARQGPAPLDQVRDLGLALSDALATLHDAGLVHRDLKPANVLLEEGDPKRPKLVDLGLAWAPGMDKLTGAGMKLGTPGYMAPEVVRGRAADHRQDLYGLGCILFEMTEGKPAFSAKGFQGLLAVVESPPPPLTRGGPALAGLVTSLLAKDPSQRPNSAREVQAALQRL